MDDEAELRRLLSWILTDFGNDVEMAADGEEALRRMPHPPYPDLVILDILMPRVDGWAVLESLGHMPVRPPVLVLTGIVDYPTFLRAIRAGAAAFMVKPFRFQDLVGISQRLLATADEAHGEERRGRTRRLLIMDVDLLSAEAAPLARGDIVNLSATGARLDLGVPLPEGERVRLAVNVPGQPRPFRFDGVVQWQKPGGAGGPGFAHGVSFQAIGEAEKKFLADIVR